MENMKSQAFIYLFIISHNICVDSTKHFTLNSDFSGTDGIQWVTEIHETKTYGHIYSLLESNQSAMHKRNQREEHSSFVQSTQTR